MTVPRSLVVVHAHPDDETLFTGAMTAWCASRGDQVTLVTCTNGRLGFDPAGRAGVAPGHDETATVARRREELEAAAALVGVTRLATLDYDDSGMAGWPQNDDPLAFVRANTDLVATQVAAVINEVAAQVVVTYDARGYYGHPDHVKTHEVTRAAIAHTPCVERLYYPVTPSSALAAFVPRARAAGVALPAWVIDAGSGTPDVEVHVTPPTDAFARAKHAALAAHASQIDNADLLTMDDELFTMLLGREYYQRGWARHGFDGDAHDLFGGLS